MLQKLPGARVADDFIYIRKYNYAEHAHLFYLEPEKGVFFIVQVFLRPQNKNITFISIKTVYTFIHFHTFITVFKRYQFLPSTYEKCLSYGI